MRMNTPETQPSAPIRRTGRDRRSFASGTDTTLLRALAHELRDPLDAVDNALTVLESNGGSISEAAKMRLVTGMREAVAIMSRTCDDLLDTQRHEAGVLQPDRRIADLAQVVRDAVENSPVRDRVELDLEPAVVPVDPAMVERILANLLQNADRYAPKGSRVTVRVAPESAGGLLEVGDEGPGVPEGERAAIFQPFWRGAGRRGTGLGIGLSLVAGFAEAHGGRAWVEPRDGGGSAFRVLFPVKFDGDSADMRRSAS